MPQRLCLLRYNACQNNLFSIYKIVFDCYKQSLKLLTSIHPSIYLPSVRPSKNLLENLFLASLILILGENKVPLLEHLATLMHTLHFGYAFWPSKIAAINETVSHCRACIRMGNAYRYISFINQVQGLTVYWDGGSTSCSNCLFFIQKKGTN